MTPATTSATATTKAHATAIAERADKRSPRSGKLANVTTTPAAATSSALTITGLVKRYGKVQAVRGIDLQVQHGEVFGFVGPNGAGKSTTIRCILDLLHPTEGQIRVLGADPRHQGAQIRERVAYVPGELRLPERLSARQFLTSIGHLRRRFDADRLVELADRFKLDLDRHIRDLSSGNRRKVSLLSAFLTDADLLILDEPTAGLDPLMQHEFITLLRERRAAGTTVFLSSHILSEVQSVADRLAVLRAGRIVASGTVNEVRSLARQRVEVWFETDAPEYLTRLPGLGDGEVQGRRFTAVLDGSARPLIDALGGQPVESILISEPDLEEAFLGLYEEESEA